MAQAKTLTTAEIERLLAHINTRKHSARNRSMMLLTHWAGLRIGEVACLRWSDVTTTDGEIKEEIRLLPDMTKGRHARTVFVSAKLKAELQAYAGQAKCVDRNYPFFASQKSIRAGFNANSLAQTFALLYEGAGVEGAFERNTHPGCYWDIQDQTFSSPQPSLPRTSGAAGRGRSAAVGRRRRCSGPPGPCP